MSWKKPTQETHRSVVIIKGSLRASITCLLQKSNSNSVDANIDHPSPLHFSVYTLSPSYSRMWESPPQMCLLVLKKATLHFSSSQTCHEIIALVWPCEFFSNLDPNQSSSNSNWSWKETLRSLPSFNYQHSTPSRNQSNQAWQIQKFFPPSMKSSPHQSGSGDVKNQIGSIPHEINANPTKCVISFFWKWFSLFKATRYQSYITWTWVGVWSDSMCLRLWVSNARNFNLKDTWIHKRYT